jgi:hypothetical protein
MIQLNYLPLATEFFFLLLGLLAVVAVVVVLLRFLGMLRRAYESLGVGPHTALLLLAGSLIGSFFDFPVAKLPSEHVTVRPRHRSLQRAVRTAGCRLAGHRARDQSWRRGDSDIDCRSTSS